MLSAFGVDHGEVSKAHTGPGKHKYDGSGQRKFVRNMAVGAGGGAVVGNLGAKVLTRGKSRFRPVRSGLGGGALGGAAGLGIVSHHRRKKS